VKLKALVVWGKV